MSLFKTEFFKDELIHYGIKRRSGRYPWGSGKDPYQHYSGDIISRDKALKEKGLSEPERAKALGLKSTAELRIEKRICKNERRANEYKIATTMREDGKTFQEIADRLGYPGESSVRALLKQKAATNMEAPKATADKLRELVEKKGYLDVGVGVEKELKVSRQTLDTALKMLEHEGYPVRGLRVHQVTNPDPNQQTTVKVLCPKGAKKGDEYKARDAGKIESVGDYTYTADGGETWNTFKYPKSLDSSRVLINYTHPDGTGGIEKDGVIELRRNVEDISLGDSSYAQVRIAVDNKYYLKGMAIYSDNIPKGYDVVFNTNKLEGTPPDKVFKKLKTDSNGNIDKQMPFGALIRENGQREYIDKDGKKQLSVINKVKDEGDWQEWNDRVSSQMLGKQQLPLIKKQLAVTYADKKAEFDEICSLTNPTIKKYFLQDFASSCDSEATNLKAAAFPGQKYQVILPINSLKDNEVYAPNYKDGSKVALIRYPHGGLFEIPICKVNNKQAEGKKVIGNATDAIGINSHVAARLSGADFDGDTVMVIPTGRRIKITNQDPLKGLEGFEPKIEYGTTEIAPDVYVNKYGKQIKVMKNTQKQMGEISNLITDMTLKSASEDELARAVRHSMTVIDAEKHKLDYKSSYEDNHILELKKKYQAHIVDKETGKVSYGASTILSSKKSDTRVPATKGQPYINIKGRVNSKTGESMYDPSRPEGALIDKPSGRHYIDEKGKRVLAVKKIPRMMSVDDATLLVSDKSNEKEMAYAKHANAMKDLANKARIEYYNTKGTTYNPTAAKTYAKEVKSLNEKLDVALSNAPRERRAQIIANSIALAKKQADPEMPKKEYKKVKQKALEEARSITDSSSARRNIKIDDNEWKAIQSGAISSTKLEQIIANSDKDKLRELATPRTNKTITPAKETRIRAMKASGLYTNADIAAAIGCSPSSISKVLKGSD